MLDRPLDLMVRKLRTRGPLGRDAAAAILALPFTLRTYESPGYLFREGQRDLDRCSFILSGYALRQKLTREGKRQILSIHIPGDFLDLQQLFLNHADHSIQALTKIEAIDLDRRALRELALSSSEITHALWIDALVEASIYREWLTNIGQRSAKARIAHLLCEVAVRLKAAGLSDGQSCELPMTQEQLGDALGMTGIHVNRMLQQLAKEGIIARAGRSVSFTDWNRISAVADFSALYLHLDLDHQN